MEGHDYLTVFWYVLGAWWVLFALAVAAIVHQWMRVEQNPLSRLPGTRISKWSSIPNWIELFRGTQPAYVHSLFEKYGPVVRVAPNQVCFWDMSALNQIYSLDEKFAKSYLHQDFTGGGPGSSSVGSSAEAAEHKRHRAKLEPLLAESAVARLYPAVNAKVKLAIQRIGEETEREGCSDVFKWWTLAMADISGELILGQSFGVLETGQSNEIVQELQDGSILALVNLILPYITPLAEYVSLGPVTRGCSARKRTFERSKEMLDKHKEAVRSAQPDQLPPSIFANLFAEQQQQQQQQQQSAEKGGSDLEQLEIISNAVTFIANGTETTANTLTYLIWAVCRHPEARLQLLEEIESLAGVPEVTDQHLRRLTYLSQVVEETLRLYPAVAGGLLRTVPAEGAEIAGHWIPGGTTVSCQAYSMHRDPKIFPNPNVFYPERWAEPTPEMRMAMMAWGGGARTCLGIHLARMELRLGAVHFFHAFPQARTSTVAGMSDADMEPEMVSFTAPKGHRCLIECK